MSIDPVCGIEMDKDLGVDYIYKGNTYYFCSEGCKRIFVKKPKKYAKQEILCLSSTLAGFHDDLKYSQLKKSVNAPIKRNQCTLKIIIYTMQTVNDAYTLGNVLDFKSMLGG